jgi:transcriptional regulator GlxA family with amidase domain
MRSTVLFLAYEGVAALDLAGPLQVFATATGHVEAKGGRAVYETIVASPEGGIVRTGAGMEINARPLVSIDPRSVDTVVVPGGAVFGPAASQQGLVDWLTANAGGIRRVCSVCTGAFMLGRAGLLDGRRVTTHWHSAARLQEMCPAARVEVRPIFLRDGSVWTSAGVSAGIDLALHLVEQDHGHKLAMDVAKTLVVFLRRPGGQPQFSTALELQSCDDPRFSSLLAWAADNLSDDLSVGALASRVGMSPRSFARKFSAAVGRTPAAAIESLRFEAAKRLLEEGDLPVKRIAAMTGFGDEQGLRRAFSRLIGITPTAYRECFG